MESWQDYRTGKAKDLGEVWALEKDSHQAQCLLRGHPIGVEALVFVDGELHRAEAFKNQKGMIDATAAWKLALEVRGWSACEQPSR